MIIDYLEKDYNTLITTLFVVCFTWLVVMVAKAKRLRMPKKS